MMPDSPFTPLYQVDAFTDQPFRGNPAAVCLLDRPRPDEWMQAVAAEMNLSETAFLLPEADGYRLRWFTPQTEVRLCGHATLASAHVLYETDRLPGAALARFYTRSGLLSASRREDGWIELDFPAATVQPVEPPPGLLEAFGNLAPRFVGKKPDSNSYLMEIDSAGAVAGLQVDFAALRACPVKSVIVTAQAVGWQSAGRSGAAYDFVSRFFAPAIGIAEDPVTGSAHCSLATYWSQRLHQTRFTAYQASARGGALGVRLEGERVILSGQAVTVLTGQIVG